MVQDANSLKKKMLKEFGEFMSVYSSLEKEVSKRFQDEFRYNKHKLSGLEDFHQLSYACKKNLTTIKSACNLIARVSDLSGYDINEEDELVKELDKLLKE
jgi:hypothetical protein